MFDGICDGFINGHWNFIIQIGFVISHQFRISNNIVRNAFNKFQLAGNFDMNGNVL